MPLNHNNQLLLSVVSLMIRHILKCLPLATLVACASIDPETGYIANRWKNSIQELGIKPVYPPFEDLYVGDIYLTTRNSTDALQTAIKLDSVSSLVNLPLYSAHRPSFSRASEIMYKTGADQSRMWMQPDGKIYSERKDSQRARLVKFPVYNFATVNNYALGANVPLSGFGALLGISRRNTGTLSVSVPAAIHASVDALSIQKAFAQRCRSESSEKYIDVIKRTSPSLSSVNGPSDKVLMLVNEVYYTYSIDYTFSSTSDMGADVKAILAAISALNVDRQKILDKLLSLRDQKNTSSPQHTEPSLKVNEEQLSNMLEQNSREIATKTAQIAPSLPGVVLTVQSGNGYEMTLRESMERPLAIGYRAIYLAMNSATCEPEGASDPGPGAPAPAAPSVRVNSILVQ